MEQYHYIANNVYNVDDTGISVVRAKMLEVLAKKVKRLLQSLV